jgi:hypothetical protein
VSFGFTLNGQFYLKFEVVFFQKLGKQWTFQIVFRKYEKHDFFLPSFLCCEVEVDGLFVVWGLMDLF